MKKRRRRLMPELEIPELVARCFREYLGPKRIANLTSVQRTNLAQLAAYTGEQIGKILEAVPTLTDAVETAAGGTD